MKILFIASAGSTHSHKWISYFVSKNYQICWASLNTTLTEVDSRVAYHQLSNAPHWSTLWLVYLRLLQLKKTFEPDIIHVHSAGSYGLMGWLLGFKNTVLTLWGSDVLLNKSKPFLRKLLPRIIASNRLVTTDAKHMISEVEALGVKSPKINLINFGVDTEKFQPKKATRFIEKKFRLQGDFRVISMRNFLPVYDLETLIRASVLVINKWPSAHFYLCGSGEQEQMLKLLVSQLKIEKNVHFLGFVSTGDLPELLNSMDAYVSTSKSDAGIASSTAEAMSCGLPAVISDVYDNKEWIRDGTSGFLFESGDEVQLAAKIDQVVKMSQRERSSIGSAARKKIVDENNFFYEMKKMEKLLEQLIAVSK